jgi:hypothetical protein
MATKKTVAKKVVAKVPAPQVTPQYEYISVEKAERFLNHNSVNRTLRPGYVEKYAADMKAGTWTTCYAPIVIYDDHEIADGQHRLFAIVESGIGQWFLVVRGADKASGLNIDMGLGRTLVDNARISGVGGQLSNGLLALSRAIEEGDRSTKRAARKTGKFATNTERLACVTKHREAAEFAMHNGGKGRGFNNAIINAAIGRAWYAEADKDRLIQFGRVFSSGFGEGAPDNAAIAMRLYFQANPGVVTNKWRDTFLKAQNAVYYFMRRKPLLVIKGVAEERYPSKKAA